MLMRDGLQPVPELGDSQQEGKKKKKRGKSWQPGLSHTVVDFVLHRITEAFVACGQTLQ